MARGDGIEDPSRVIEGILPYGQVLAAYIGLAEVSCMVTKQRHDSAASSQISDNR